MKKLHNISKLDAKRRFAPLLRLVLMPPNLLSNNLVARFASSLYSVLTLSRSSSRTKCWRFASLLCLILAIILSFAPSRTLAQEQAHVHINVLNQLSEYVPNSLIHIKDRKGNILK